MNNRTVIIFGSSASQGDTRKIVEALRKKIDADLIDLNELNIGYFDYEFKNRGDDFLSASKEILKYDNIIFASPVYWYSMSAVMKTFVDRLSDLLKIRKEDGRRLRGKALYVVSSSSDREVIPSFIKTFELTAEYLGMTFGGYLWGWVENDKVPKEVLPKLNQFATKINSEKD